MPQNSQEATVRYCHELRHSFESLFNEFSSEVSVRMDEIASLRERTSALRADIARLRERIASTHKQILRI